MGELLLEEDLGVHQNIDAGFALSSKRDNWTCQKCKARRREGSVVVLNAHHKKSFAVILNEHNIKTYKDFIGCDEIWEIDNGITFCDKCHTEFHTKYGTTNNTSEQTKEFTKKVIGGTMPTLRELSDIADYLAIH